MPTGVKLRASDGGLHVDAGGQSWAGSDALEILDDADQWSVSEGSEIVERVVRATLSGVQDAISRARAEVWPSVPGSPSVMAHAEARVVDGVLHVWFGDEDAPVLRFDPIPLDILSLPPTV
ncbi:MAG: hypothetical protein ACT4P1_07250 [Sporichthyaceae bacterium]